MKNNSFLDNFKSTLILQVDQNSNNSLDSLNNPNLDSTTDIILIKNIFTTDRGRILVEYTGKSIKIYRLRPHNLIKEIECKEHIIDMAFIGGIFWYLTERRLVGPKTIEGDFKGVKLVEVGDCVGLQYSDRLILYNDNIEYSANTSYYKGGVLLTSFGFILTVYLNNPLINPPLINPLLINLPQSPTSLCCDILLNYIYCGTKSGDILSIRFDGTPGKILEYHKIEIVSIRISFCTRFLYSVDKSGLCCVWCTKFNVVIDKIELGCGVLRMESCLTGGEGRDYEEVIKRIK